MRPISAGHSQNGQPHQSAIRWHSDTQQQLYSSGPFLGRQAASSPTHAELEYQDRGLHQCKAPSNITRAGGWKHARLKLKRQQPGHQLKSGRPSFKELKLVSGRCLLSSAGIFPAQFESTLQLRNCQVKKFPLATAAPGHLKRATPAIFRRRSHLMGIPRSRQLDCPSLVFGVQAR
jgi:hypothetical protein